MAEAIESISEGGTTSCLVYHLPPHVQAPHYAIMYENEQGN